MYGLMLLEESTTSTSALSTLGEAFDFIAEKLGDMVDVIVAHPILLLPVGIFVAGAAIGLAGRLIGR